MKKRWYNWRQCYKRGVLTTLRKKYHNRCASCGRTIGLGPHEIFPRKRGGLTAIENLVLLCYDCHNTAEDLRLSRDQIESGAYCGGGVIMKVDDIGHSFEPKTEMNSQKKWKRPTEIAEMLHSEVVDDKWVAIIINSRGDQLYRNEIIRNINKLCKKTVQERVERRLRYKTASKEDRNDQIKAGQRASDTRTQGTAEKKCVPHT